MTWYEAYQRVCFKIWGNSAVPSGTAAVLQGDEGIIANVHRKLQQDYNYWFMQTWGTITTVAGTYSYSLPTDFKEMISAAWEIVGNEYTLTGDFTVDSATVTNLSSTESLSAGMLVYHSSVDAGTTIDSVDSSTQVTISANANATATSVSILFTDGKDYFGDVISPVSTQAAQATLWQSDNTAEYPYYYEITKDVLTLYPKPEDSNRVLHLLYWQFLDRPTSSDFESTATTTDDLLTYGSDAVVNLACAEMAEILKEYDMAQYYEKRSGQALDLLKNEDRRRRQSPHYFVHYAEF